MLYPALFALFPILSLYAQNVHETPPSQLIGPLALALSGSALVWLILRGILGDARKAGLIATLGVIVFYTIAQLNENLNTFLQAHWTRRQERYGVWPPLLIGSELALVGVLVRWVLVRLRDSRKLTSYLNLFAAVLVALPVGEAVQARASQPVIPSQGAPPFALGEPPKHVPDIYYIILDAYARSDVMAELFGFDNAPFLRRLEARGFYVAGRSTANYCQTPLCLSSSLNGCYLDDLVKGLETDQTQLTPLIADNALARTLRPLGYKFVTFSTGFDPTENPKADVYLAARRPYSGFHRLLIDSTPLWSLLPDPQERDSYTMARERILYLLDNVPKIARDRSPTFTFAHILCPHPPFIFGEHGEDVSRRDVRYLLDNGERLRGHEDEASEEYRESYRAQAVFITERVERMIDEILKNSPEPPIIILQSDHGSGLELHMQSVEKTNLRERMSILNAYYFPGERFEGLNDRITPVNSFRVVLNTYFDAHLPLLPERSYFSTWPEPYRFMDVTDRVRAAPDGYR